MSSKTLKSLLVAQAFVTVPACADNTVGVDGVSSIRLISGRIRLAELHWYEAHGIGRKEYKIKLPFLD